MFLFRRKQTHAMVSSGDQHSCLWDKSGGLQQLFDSCFPKTLLILTTADGQRQQHSLVALFLFPAAFAFKLSPGNSDRKDEGISERESIVNCIFFSPFCEKILLSLLANIADQRHQIVNCHMDLAV